MSLVTDEVLLRLWNKVQQKGSRENVAGKFWLQFYSKYMFTGKEWVISVEAAPSELELSMREDIKVEYLGYTDLEVLLHHELKRNEASKSDLEQVEHQAYGNCISHLTAHPELSRIYAVTSFGTKARMWTCQPDSHYLEPLFGSMDLADPLQYIEAHSSDANKLQQGFEHMKRFPPVARRGIEPGERSPGQFGGGK